MLRIVRPDRHRLCDPSRCRINDSAGMDPFKAQMLHPRIGDYAGGCAFRCATHRISDFAPPSGEFGLPLHHPRFLEWVGAPEFARLMGPRPDAWFRSLTCTQSIDAAHQSHRDV